MNKTTLRKYIQIINKTKKKVLRCEDISKETGEKIEVIRKNLSPYNPLINFDINFNVKNIKEELEKELKELEIKEPIKRKTYVKNNELVSYSSTLEYIYKNMCVSGGILDVGYPLTKKDIIAIKKLLKKDEEKLK